MTRIRSSGASHFASKFIDSKHRLQTYTAVGSDRPQACGFNFEKINGSLGRNFIEAHHLKSLWTMKGTKVELDPRTDFAVLCPNCHRMIHQTEDPGDVPGFRKLIRK